MHKRSACARAAAVILSVAMIMTSLPASVLAEESVSVEETAVVQEAAAAEEAVEEAAVEEAAEEPAAESVEEADAAEEAVAEEDEEVVDVIPEDASVEMEVTEGTVDLSVEEAAEEEEIILDASEDAEVMEVAEETESSTVTWPRYGTMTMTYEEFYSALVSDSKVVDAVSSSTTRKYKMFENADATEPTDSGYQINGVKNVPVVVTEDAPDNYKDRVTFNDNVDKADVKQYWTVDAKGISGVTLNTEATVSDATAVLNTSSNWGDYCIEITENTTSYLRNQNTDYKVGANVMGVILETSDGQKVGLTHMKNIWVKTYEVAFSTDDNSEMAKLEGKTITSVTYIVPDGAYVYNFSGIYLKPSYNGEAVTGSFTTSDTGTTFTLNNLPESLANPKISISYSSGHHNTTTLVDSQTVSADSFTIQFTGEIPAGTLPTVTISSDNCADVEVTYPLFGTTKTNLDTLIAKGKALVNEAADPNYTDGYKELSEKVTAAEEMLASALQDASNYKSATVTALEEAIDAASIKYGTMTMSYSEFYSGMASTGSVDSVSSATTGKSKMFTNADATDVTSSGYQINGVKNIPVKVMPSTSDTMKARVTMNAEDAEIPTQYYTLDANGIGKWTQNTAATVTDATATLSTSSRYGDYEIDVTENSTAYVRNDRTDTRPVNSTIVGIVLKTASGKTYGMGHMQNIWIQPYKLAFDVDGVYSSLVGETVTQITYIIPTASYVFDLGSGVYIKPAYNGSTISGTFSDDGTTFTLNNAVDSSLTNAKISVSYRSGRQTVSLLSATEVGSATSFTLSTTLPDETVPTVTISSDNYADVTVSYPMFDWQKTQLEEQIATGLNAITYGGADATLSAHIAEAQALLANASATAAEASELYKELSSLVSAALAKVPADTLELSAVTLAETSYTYDATAKNPAVASVVSKDGTVVDAANYTVTYSEGCTAVGTYQVTVTGRYGFNGSASATFTIKASDSVTYATIKLSKTSYTYNGKKKKPGVTVTLMNGKKLAKKYYKVTYKNNKKVGTATVTVTGKGKYAGKQTVTFTINPKGTSIKKKTAKKNGFRITWKKRSKANGYQIQYSTSKKFTDSTTVTVSKKKTSYRVKNLKAKTTYYVRIRTYRTVKGTKYYSSWSKKVKVKTK